MRIKLPKVDYSKIIHHFTIGIDILFVIFLLMNYFGGVAGAWENMTSYIFYFAVAVNTLFFASKIHKIPEDKREDSKMIYYFSHFFLLTLVIIVINQFLKKQWLIDNLGYLTVISIAFGFLTFYAYRNKVEKDIEKEKVDEEKAEKKRKEGFGDKFPKLNKIPILKYLLRWMYTVGWKFSIPFVVIVTLFVAIKIGMPLIYGGTFIDEYFHIFSGIELFKTGHFAEIYSGGNYLRGPYVSFFVGLLTFLFGTTIFVAKMVPAILGIINFFLLYILARKIITRKKYILMLMLTYSLFLTTTINHFYIRMYVFYETFLLLIVLWFLYLNKLIINKKWRRVTLNIIIIIIINLIFRIITNGPDANLINLISLLFFLSIIFSFLRSFLFNKKILYALFGIMFSFMILTILGIYPIQHIASYLLDIINSEGKYLGGAGYFQYFFKTFNLFFSAFFLLSLGVVKNKKIKFIIYPMGALFLIHLFSPLSLQVIRGILYFIPIFLLIGFFGIERFGRDKILKLSIAIIIFLTIWNSYPPGFFETPYLIKNELNYVNNDIFKEIPNYCENSILITSSRPGIFLIYSLKPDYYLNTKYGDESWVLGDLESTFAYSNKSSGKFIDSYSDTEIIKSSEEFDQILNKHTKICFIYGGLPHSWMDSDSRRILEGNFTLILEYPSNVDYNNMRLYLHDRDLN
jgi:hypothetical protein